MDSGHAGLALCLWFLTSGGNGGNVGVCLNSGMAEWREMSKVWGLRPGGAPRKAGFHLELLVRRDSREKLGMKYVHVLKKNKNDPL